MIFTKSKIVKEIKSKRIIISPNEKLHIGPASIDLTLGNKIRVFNKIETVFDITKLDIRF